MIRKLLAAMKNDYLAAALGAIAALAPLLRFSTDLEIQLLMHALLLAVFLVTLNRCRLPYKTAFTAALLVLFLSVAPSLFSAPEKATARNAFIVLFDGLLAAYLVSLLGEKQREAVLAVPVFAGFWFSVVLIVFFLRSPLGFFHRDPLPAELVVNQNIIAGYLTLAFPLSLAAALRKGKTYLALSAALFLGILLTQSRTALFVALAISGGFVFLYHRTYRRYFLVLAALCAGYFLFLSALKLAGQQAWQSTFLENRLVWWHTAWNMFLDSPLRGIGWGNFENLSLFFRTTPALNTAYAHNIVLQLLAEAGVIGFCGFCLLLVVFFRRNAHGAADPVRQAVFAAAAGFLLENTLDYGFFIPALLWTFFLCIGAGFSHNAEKRRKPLVPAPVLLLALGLLLYPSGRVFLGSVHLHRGLYLEKQKDLGPAEKELERSAAFDPLPALPYSALAEARFGIYSAKNDRAALRSALDAQRKALERAPRRASLWSDLAWLLWTSGAAEEAYAAIEQAAACDRHNPRYRETMLFFAREMEKSEGAQLFYAP